MFELAIDTSTARTYVALSTPGNNITERSIDSLASHNESLADLTSELLREAGVELSSLSSLTIGSGPGSFTGLRIGYSFAKGLVFGSNIAFRQISSLSAMSYKHKDDYKLLLSIAFAGQGNYFFQIFDSADGRSNVITEAASASPEAISQQLELLKNEAGFKDSDVAMVFSDQEDLGQFPCKSGKCFIAGEMASSLIRLSAGGKEGFLTGDLLQLSKAEPTYIREVAAKSLADRGIAKPFSY